MGSGSREAFDNRIETLTRSATNRMQRYQGPSASFAISCSETSTHPIRSFFEQEVTKDPEALGFGIGIALCELLFKNRKVTCFYFGIEQEAAEAAEEWVWDQSPSSLFAISCSKTNKLTTPRFPVQNHPTHQVGTG